MHFFLYATSAPGDPFRTWWNISSSSRQPSSFIGGALGRAPKKICSRWPIQARTLVKIKNPSSRWPLLETDWWNLKDQSPRWPYSAIGASYRLVRPKKNLWGNVLPVTRSRGPSGDLVNFCFLAPGDPLPIIGTSYRVDRPVRAYKKILLPATPSSRWPLLPVTLLGTVKNKIQLPVTCSRWPPPQLFGAPYRLFRSVRASRKISSRWPPPGDPSWGLGEKKYPAPGDPPTISRGF